MGRAASGETSTLSRYGITLDKGLAPSEKFAAALEKINEQFGGQAQSKAETFGGRIEQLSNALGDSLEIVGSWITQSRIWNELVEQTTSSILAMNSALQLAPVDSHTESIKRAGEAADTLSGLEADLAEAIRFEHSQLGQSRAEFARRFGNMTDVERITKLVEAAELKFVRALAIEAGVWRELNVEQGKNLELDKEALKAAEKLGIVLQENVNVAIAEKQKALEQLRENQDALGISDTQLFDKEKELREEQERLQAAFDASGGSLAKYNAALEGTKAALEPVVAGLVAAREAVASYNVETEQTIQQQQVLAKSLVFTAENFRQVAREQGRAAAVAAALSAGARRGVGNRIEFFDEFGRRTGSELGPRGGRFRLNPFVLTPFGSPRGTNADGTPRRR